MPLKQSTPAIVTPPLVSAIVSTYNAERFIQGCLEDLEAQTIADRLEIVVVDSGSQQNEWAIVREFQQRYDNILYIPTAQREGLYAAWNRGIQAARGKYITNANTDDRHRRDAFERLVATLDTRPDIALVYADFYITEIENETFENHTPVGESIWPDFDPLELLRRCYMGHQPMWRKSMHTRYGYFDESFEVAGDWEFWLRMAENETFLHLREFLGLFLNSPASVGHRNPELLGQENVRVRQRYRHRADQLTKARTVSGATVTKPMAIKAYKLSNCAAVIQPAQAERDEDTAHGAVGGAGWVVLCPHGFEATWNGGPNPDDIAIRLDAPDADVPAFVQSTLGGGLLTFYSGYQVQTERATSLWVRGPINRSKDGLYPLEQIVDTSVLPGTIAVNWTFTRPNQTVRFAAGEPFGALLLYPKNASEPIECEVVRMEEAPEAYAQELQQLIQAPAIQDVLQRLQSAGEPAAMAEPPAVSVPKETVVSWAGQLTKSNPGPVENAPLAVVISVRNRAGQRVRNTLHSLAWQTAGRPAQVIVVSFGSRADVDQELAAICADEDVTLLTVGTPTQPWNKSFALNYGIRATRPEIPYLMTMDADMILAPNFLAVVVQRLQRQPPALVLCRSSDLPEHSTLPGHPEQVLEAFQALHASCCLRDRTGTGGIQAARRSFFFAIRGYDEDLIWWGAEDGDVVNRAQRMGLAIEWVEDRTAMLHQWHPRTIAGLTDPSEIEQATYAWGYNHDLVQSRSTIVQRNPEGWGGIADAATDEAAYEQDIQRMAQDPALQTIFQRRQGGDEPIAPSSIDLADTNRSWDAQLTNPPPVSCICPTYGRVALLEEAMYCFLLQDYPGPKELIVLNDYVEQTLVFDHPEVRVINLPKRFRTVGEKRNAGVALASHDLLFPWDDDDIYLPHRLSYSVAKFEAQKGFFKPSPGWVWQSGHVHGPKESRFHASSCWSRDRFDAVRGYASEGSGHDQIFEERLAQRFPGITATFPIQPAEIYYIYRWYGTGSYHLSGFGGLKPGENSGDAEVAAYIQRRASRGAIRQGRILLRPHWNADYQQLVSQYIQALAENQTQPRATAVFVSRSSYTK